MVKFIPFFCKISEDLRISFNLAPKLTIATFLPSLTTLPLPTINFSSIDGSLTPNPLPLGYLNAQGLSLISIEVFIILTSSASSLAAITIKLGKVVR